MAPLPQEPAKVVPLSGDAAEALWATLAGPQSVEAFRAMLDLLQARGDAVRLCARKLGPARSADPTRIRELVAKLDDPTFSVREKATRELEGMARAGGPDTEGEPQGVVAESRGPVEKGD